MVLRKAAHFSLIQNFFHAITANRGWAQRAATALRPYKVGGHKWYSGRLFLTAKADIP
jgi:hypothetical protein